jgi:putative membrane protein
MRRIALLAAAASLPLASCATKQPTPRAPSPSTPVVRSIAVSPADYVAAAASTSLLIIKTSEQIAAREGDTRLGQSARQFQSEQEGIGAQLSFAGRRLNLLPSATLLPRDQAYLDELERSPDPRATYIRQMKSLLPGAAAFHRQYERYGTSPTLRPVAAMAAPVVERELRIIQRFRP